MPPICWHMVTVREAAMRVKSPLLEANLGTLFLGSTAPDARVMMGVPRPETHFYDFEKKEAQSGVEALFKRHPQLSPSKVRDPATRAFVTGYLTHLAIDELWIQEIYRPFFGYASTLAGDPMADVMDRALQFNMDRQERLDRACMKEIRTHVVGPLPGEAMGLLDALTLLRWRERVANIAEQEPTWELLLSFLGRFFSTRMNMDASRVQELLDSLPQVLDRTLRHVTPERIVAFREEAVARSAEVAQEYLL